MLKETTIRTSLLISLLVKKILVRYVMISMKLKGKRFHCRALKGDPDYIMSIASDLSLSCNCNDKYGLGKIGNIRSQSLFEMLSGGKASHFRRMLSLGRIPIINCISCKALALTEKEEAHNYLNNYQLPSGIMVENTVNCNLKCIACERERIYKHRAQRFMPLDDIKYISKCLKDNHIQIIHYFNYGEPFLSNTIKEELEIIRGDNSDISIITSTNGTLLHLKEKMEAALYFDHIYFSIDGATQESASRYQRGIDFKKVYSNMKALVEIRNSRNKKRPVVEWKYVLFRWNDSPKLISLAIQLAREAKVDIISFWPTISPLYGISFRYYFGFGYFKHIGHPSWKGREIDFRQQGIS